MEDIIRRLDTNDLASWAIRGVMPCGFNERQAHCFLDALDKNTTLRELILQGPAYEEHLIGNKYNCKQLINAIVKLPVIESLEIISGCSLERKHVMSLMAIKPLNRLVLKNCIRIISHEVPIMFQAALEQHPFLTHVELQNIYMVGYAAGQEQSVPSLDPILYALASISSLQHAVVSCMPGTHTTQMKIVLVVRDSQYFWNIYWHQKGSLKLLS